MFDSILSAYGLNGDQYQIEALGTGLINHTWKVIDGEPQYILQRVNKSVFSNPGKIAENIDEVSNYLQQHSPGYYLPVPVKSLSGKSIIKYTDEEYYRLLPYVKNSVTITTVQTKEEAFEAASQFAKFTGLLADFDSSKLHYILPGFHDLTNRFAQFEEAVKTAKPDRKAEAQPAVEKAFQHQNIAAQYRQIVEEKSVPLRVIHHDTKISNVLFDSSGKGLCVIDLDTVMPGYYISDVGDMMRTYLCPVSEEEKDFSKITVRDDFFEAIAAGYFGQMGTVLTQTEKSLFVYSGKFMIYMQVLRFLTDFLNNDIYYGSAYPGHNLIRAQNQLTLLRKYLEKETIFERVIANI